MVNIAKAEFKLSWGGLMTVNLLRAPRAARYKYVVSVSAILPEKEDWRYRDFRVEVKDREGGLIKIFSPGRPDDPLAYISNGMNLPFRQYSLDYYVDALPSVVPERVGIWLRNEHCTAWFSP